jgi:signal transduction histidine kinase
MFLIGQRLVGRIRELERRTRQIAAGDFSPMPLPASNDELLDLSQSVNEMAQRLAQFQDTARTTERLRLLGQLSSGLAHQLRNSVTGARLAIQLHADECSQSDREALQVALRQLNLMEANLRRFLDLGKSEGRVDEHCLVPALIDEVLALLRPQAQHAGIDVRWQPLTPALSPQSRGEGEMPSRALAVKGDAGQLRDAFMNVIGNAIEAASPNGSVEITCSFSDEKQASICIDVIDTGPGPPATIAARLFEPFVTGRPEGIGLGLAVARHAVEMHGGGISWRREEGKTVFRIELPALAQ